MNNLTDQDEIQLLRQGMDSEFWALLVKKWGNFRQLAMNSLLSPDYKNRDFLAGKVAGMDALLGYPQKHIKMLEDKAKKGEANGQV